VLEARGLAHGAGGRSAISRRIATPFSTVRRVPPVCWMVM
jgi:hypothetical protein